MLLATDRVNIRPFQHSDLSDYSRIVADPDVMRYLTGEPQSMEEARQYVEECIASEKERGYSRYAVLLKQSGELIGFCGYKLIDGEIDFGWRYAKAHWRKGYGTEAATAVLHYGLRTLRLPMLVTAAFPENIASIRIMQKIGMQQDGFGQWNGRKTVRYIVKSTSPYGP